MVPGGKDKYIGANTIYLTDENFGYLDLKIGTYILKIKPHIFQYYKYIKKSDVKLVLSVYSESVTSYFSYLFLFFIGI